MSEIAHKDWYDVDQFSTRHVNKNGPLATIDEIAYSIGGKESSPTFVSLTDTLKVDNWNAAYSAKHTHSNQEVLDGITSTKVSNWDSASTNSHTHSNKSVLDNLTQTVIDNSHTHSNKSVLDGITADKISQWDKGTVPNDGKLTIKMNGAAVTGSFTANQATDSVIDLGTVVTNVTKATEIAASSTDAQYPSAKAVYTFVNTKTSTLESTDNKTQSVTDKSTETQYPSAKAVYDAIVAKECVVQTVDTEKHTVTINDTNVYYQLGLDDEGKLTLTITAADTPKTTVTITAPTAKTLTYTGKDQTLANAATCSISGGATIYYGLTSSTVTSTTVPAEDTAGDYTVYWKATANDGYTISGTSSGSISVTINKKALQLTIPSSNVLTYTGEAQELVTPGSSENPTDAVKWTYKLSTESTYSTAIPTGTEAGEYTVDYKGEIVNSNYVIAGGKTSTTGSVNVIISEAATDYGYYSFNATAKSEVSSLTASDFTKLTASTGNLDPKVGGMIVFALPTTVTNAPTFTCHSKAAGTDSEITLCKAGTSTTGTTISISGTTYNIWYNTYPIAEDDEYITYIIN